MAPALSYLGRAQPISLQHKVIRGDVRVEITSEKSMSVSPALAAEAPPIRASPLATALECTKVKDVLWTRIAVFLVPGQRLQ